MIKNSSVVSFENWKRNAAELFFFSERELTSKEEMILENYSFYTEYLSKLIYNSYCNLRIDIKISYTIFNVIMYLLKSTLFFDFSLSQDLNTKDSKKALIYGDLYLLQGGVEFRKIDNYDKILNFLSKTLYSISLSHNLESRVKNPDLGYLSKILKLRYGSIFKLAFIIPYNIKNIEYNKREIYKLLDYNAIYISIKNNLYIQKIYKNLDIVSYEEKIKNILEINKNKGEKLIECYYS